jgi:hypothetical protein
VTLLPNSKLQGDLPSPDASLRLALGRALAGDADSV